VWILIPDADGKKHKLPGRIISIFFLDIIEDLNAAKIEPSSKHAEQTHHFFPCIFDVKVLKRKRQNIVRNVGLGF
jgi:hypothetical protein